MTVELEKLEVYQLSESLADSVGANIAEGYGRFAFKENIQFCYYARGSLMEVKHFLRRASKRKLLNPDQVAGMKDILQPLAPKLNVYIRSIKSELTKSKQMATDK